MRNKRAGVAAGMKRGRARYHGYGSRSKGDQTACRYAPTLPPPHRPSPPSPAPPTDRFRSRPRRRGGLLFCYPTRPTRKRRAKAQRRARVCVYTRRVLYCSRGRT